MADAAAIAGGRAAGRAPVLLPLVLRRIGVSLLLLLTVSLVVFAGTELLPGDVAQMVLGQSATPESLAGLRAALHLDQPAFLRYLHWLAGLLTGNPGTSLVNGMPVAELIG